MTAQSALAGTTCIELALEGERLCKSGDPKNGARFFEEARKVGTDDSHTLSAIYSQLGNAYFALSDYLKALDCHKMDVEITQNANDQVAEAKACGNLGNVYKMLGKFEEAAVYCRRYLNICQKLNDREGEARALYNLANVYHTQGKRLISSCDQEFGELSRDIKSSLERAVDYYEKTLDVVTEMSDFTTMGKSYGNLGNTHYLLGNFSQAVDYHKKRLELAQSIQDKLGERRALLNLGNANVFVGDFQGAIENYSATLKMAQEFGDKNTESHACYSLANSYTFLRDYRSAVNYHLKYLELIKNTEDKLGEGRAYWSLVNLYLMLHNPAKALIFARKHHEIAEMLNDKAGLASAKLNIQELEDLLAQKRSVPSSSGVGQAQSSSVACDLAGSRSNDNPGHDRDHHHKDGDDDEFGFDKLESKHLTYRQKGQETSKATLDSKDSAFHQMLDKRREQEHRRFKKQLNINLTGDIDGLNARRRTKQYPQDTQHRHQREHPRGGPVRSTSSERLFDMIAHFQSGRIDDQRCEILKNRPTHLNKTGGLLSSSKKKSSNTADSYDNSNNNNNKENVTTNSEDNLVSSNSTTRSSQPSINPISVAASAIKATYRKASLAAYPISNLGLSTNHNASNSNQPITQQPHQRRPTVSTEHQEQLFDLIAGAQRRRMDEQRASLPSITIPNGMHPTNKEVAALMPTPNKMTPNHVNIDCRSSTLRNEDLINPSSVKSSDSSSSNSIKGPGEPSMGPPGTSRGKSNSIIVPPQFRDDPARSGSISTPDRPISAQSGRNFLSKQFQTFDSNSKPTELREDAKFLDNLMKYQSTRFNDQRSEFPRIQSTSSQSSRQSVKTDTTEQSADNFFNLIVRFQSDRFEDQRSVPPPTTTKNLDNSSK